MKKEAQIERLWSAMRQGQTRLDMSSEEWTGLQSELEAGSVGVAQIEGVQIERRPGLVAKLGSVAVFMA